MVVSIEGTRPSKEPEMIEFALSDRGLHFRCQHSP